MSDNSAELPKISTVVVAREFDQFLLDVIERVRIQTLPTEEVVVVRTGGGGGAGVVPEALQALTENGIWTHGAEHCPVRVVAGPDEAISGADAAVSPGSDSNFIEDPSPDVIAALNAGIEAATQELVAVVTPGLMPEGPHFLGALAMPFVDRELAAVYGRTLAGEELARHNPAFARMLYTRLPRGSRVQAFPDAAFNLRFFAVRKSVWVDRRFAAGEWPRAGFFWARGALQRGLLIRYEASNIASYQAITPALRSVGAAFQSTYSERTAESKVPGGTSAVRLFAGAVSGMTADVIDLTRRGKPHAVPKAWAMRGAAAAGALTARRNAASGGPRALDNDGDTAENESPRALSTDEVLRLMHVSRRYRLLRRAPKTWGERVAHIAGRGRRGLHNEFWAVKDVSFAVKRGEIVGVCGGNGSGKSTLLKVVARIAPASRGTVIVRGRVAPLLEVGTGFLPDYSGRENIALNALLLGLTPEEIAARQDSMIEFAELGGFIDAPVKTYSAGMLMRLGFAILTHVEADILLIDEVLAVGDAAFQKKCNAWLRTLKEKGTTVMLVSHDLPTMEELCDRVLWMQDGRLVGDGPAGFVIDRYQRFSMGVAVG